MNAGHDARAERSSKRRRIARRILDVLIVAWIVLTFVDFAPHDRPPDLRDARARWELVTAVSALRTFREGNPTVCPSLDDPRLGSGSTTKDPWNRPLHVECDDGGVSVASAGRDGRWGTTDDIRERAEVGVAPR